MGATLSSHDNLVHARGWTSEQILTLFDRLRKNNLVYSVTKDDYTRFVGGRNREAILLFSDLDTDYDGKVDIFEVFTMLVLWSGTDWDQKKTILFRLFDMMHKGFLKVDEVMLMATVIVRVVGKFVQIDRKFQESGFLREIAHKAFANEADAQLKVQSFKLWLSSCEPLGDLKAFIDDYASRAQPESNESKMRIDLGAVEAYATKLFERIERLNDRLPDFVDACLDHVNAWGRRKRWDFLMQNLRHLNLKLQQVSEDMHVGLTDLAETLNEDEASGGLASMIDPRRRFQQEHMLLQLNLLKQGSLNDYREATTLLQRLIELSEPENVAVAMDGVESRAGTGLDAIQEGNEGVFDAPPRAAEAKARTKQLCEEMVADIQEGGAFAPPTLESLTKKAQNEIGDNQEAEGDLAQQASAMMSATSVAADSNGVRVGDSEPTLIVIADFVPPESHQSQMLSLTVGELITVLGQDGRGWWYGKKSSGQEGWFPPSYVQVKPAHFSSPGDADDSNAAGRQ